jgi:hypothetical protein
MAVKAHCNECDKADDTVRQVSVRVGMTMNEQPSKKQGSAEESLIEGMLCSTCIGSVKDIVEEGDK